MTVVINGTTGYSGPVGVLGDLTTTGNTILGDQSTDTLNVANGNLVLNSSGNLGVGTSSPASKLDVVGANKTNANEYGVITAWSSDSYAADKGGSLAFWGKYNSSSGNACFGRIYGAKENGTDGSFLGYLGFSTSPGGTPVERMRLDSSGNLGLGVTPSAWSGMKAFQLGDGTFAMSSDGAGAGDGSLTWNGYYNGTNWIYGYTGGGANRFRLNESGAAWFTAPSGTAGNAISWTQAMTLDASGNLLVGQTSSTDSSFRLQLTGAGGSIHAAMGTNSNALRFSNVNTSGVEWAVGTSSPGVANAGNFLSFTQFSGGSWAERARINSAGDLGIGTASPGARLEIYQSAGGTNAIRMNTNFGSGNYVDFNPSVAGVSNNGFSISLNGVIRQVINGSGNLGIGTTSPALTTPAGGITAAGAVLAKGYINDHQTSAGVMDLNGNKFSIRAYGATANTGFIAFNVAGGGGSADSEASRITANRRWCINTTVEQYSSTMTIDATGNSYNITSAQTGTGTQGHMVFGNANGAVGTIQTTGSSTAYNTSSDYRLKNTIAPMTGALAKVAQLKPVTYKWNVDGSEGEGFIAHELAEVVPQAVTGAKDAVDEEGNPQYQGIDVSFLVATLTAAIQELKSELDSVKTELAALKGN